MTERQTERDIGRGTETDWFQELNKVIQNSMQLALHGWLEKNVMFGEDNLECTALGKNVLPILQNNVMKRLKQLEERGNTKNLNVAKK